MGDLTDKGQNLRIFVEIVGFCIGELASEENFLTFDLILSHLYGLYHMAAKWMMLLAQCP